MTDSTSSHPACIVLGDVRLLTQTRHLSARDVIVLVSMPATTSQAAPNTIVLNWNQWGPARLVAQTVDGNHRMSAQVQPSELFDAALPSAALRGMIGEMFPSPDEATAVTPYAPLFCIIATPADHEAKIQVYSQIRFLADDACFIRITPTPLHVSSVADLSWLTAALDLHHQKAQFLNSHECHYQKLFGEQEMEHKYTLTSTTDIWTLAIDTLRQLHAGQIPGFIPKYRDEFESWDYLNCLFDITGPEPDRGYVSFMPTANGTYIIKRKWFSQDTFSRREVITRDVSIGGSLEDYARETLHLNVTRLPPFRRVRYDINLESTYSGNIFTILYDHCSLVSNPALTLTQCELEYISTRRAIALGESDVLVEMNSLACWLEERLANHRTTSHHSFYSKLTFLRETVSQHPKSIM